jgi:hypothetical protein
MIRRLTFFTIINIFTFLSAQSYTHADRYAVFEPVASSVLAEGKWFKMKITSTGIYKLTYDDLLTMGFSDPSAVRIFGNGGGMLSLMNSDSRYDDLIENAVYRYTGNDGVFNKGDYILFYAAGTVKWNYNLTTSMFEQQLHQYSEAAWYFVTDAAGTGKTITERNAITATSGTVVTSFDDYSFHEKNKYNVLKSGRQWFGERLDFSAYDTTFIFNNLVASSPVKIKVNVCGRSGVQNTFIVSLNDAVIGSILADKVDPKIKTGAYANQKSALFSKAVSNDNVKVRVSYSQASSDDEGYLDYITVNARRQLVLSGDVMYFRDRSNIGITGVVTYNMANCTDQTEIWDLTDPFNIVKVPAQLSGTTLSFTDSTYTLKEYVAFKKGAAFLKPVTDTKQAGVGIVSNQNLHSIGSAQMLIITHPLFKPAADSIADFHRNLDGLSVAVATTDQVFNEFSSGAPDVSAIRDFARMIYKRGTVDNRLKYLLLVGDGSYNNISAVAGNANFILTYQSENSLNASFSYVSDDFFGILEDGEGGTSNMEDFSLDLGIGRLPVKTEEEAMSIYGKLKSYTNSKNKGDWQNNILFAADDQDGNLHMTQANELATWVDNNHPEMAVKKVFMDAYPQVSSSSGARYPDVNRTLAENFEKGLLIFNYTGHGGEQGLADEQILMREDLASLTNFNRLPLFMTATCEFSRFDDLTRDGDGNITESTSAGEYSILNPRGGSIGLITTTRIVYSNENHALNSRFYQIAFTRDPSGQYYRLGDLIRLTKNVLDQSRNKLNFTLLGDPALRLAIPEYTVATDSVNHVPVTEPVDTLKAFSRIIVSGHIENASHQLMQSYNGLIFPSVYDKAKTITTLANDVDTKPMQFSSREDLLYKGKASVTNGRFTFEFIVPKDITYNYGNGRIIYYSESQSLDAKGEFSRIVIGGTDRTAEQDVTGPEISLYLNDEKFNDKGITNTNPVIYALISDESGINTIGNGIGHDITGVIDGDVTNPVIMNEYFQSDLNHFNSGTVAYPMTGLTEGLHSLRLKVWDVYNNSSEAVIEFRVIPGDEMMITRLGNYPNPARDHTIFTFEHNHPEDEVTAAITVFDLQGRIIYNYTEVMHSTGFNTSLPVWDLRDSNGNLIKPGIYPYRIRLTSSKGLSAESFQKLVVLR